MSLNVQSQICFLHLIRDHTISDFATTYQLLIRVLDCKVQVSNIEVLAKLLSQ